MPRIKIDYVVSFSSEEPDHPASNLLAWEVSKKKWLCKKGESSCSVVLQLTNAVKISSVHIGAYHSALVEVLVARSEKGNEQYQVLVPSCVFVPPRESRRAPPVERVRSFPAEQLAELARDQRWDRVRVVCSQPYNKHCSYGLSFIHIDGESERAPAAVPPRLLTLDTYSSDEEEFRPGELFAKHSQGHSDSQNSATDTGAQIRQATSQVLKNLPESNTKLMKTPISKPTSRRDRVSSSEGRSDRTRDTLLYTQDDEKPHSKIDKVVQRHKDQKEKEIKSQEKREKLNDSFKRTAESEVRKRKKSDTPPPRDTPAAKKTKESSNKGDAKMRRRSSSNEAEPELAQESDEPHTLLRDVVLVLSGYQNPERATVRNTALALGARVERDWGPACTHLVCAFPNTPKLRQVRAAGGADVPVVLADWVLQCGRRRRRLPWRWFATEPRHRRPEGPLPPLANKRTHKPPVKSPTSPPRGADDTDCDTDEEIEKVLRQQKAKQTTVSDDVTPAATTSHTQAPSSDVEDGSTTEEEVVEEADVPRFGGALPNFFDGHTFAIDAEGADAEQLSRYVKAYGGLVLQMSDLNEECSVEYTVCGAGGGCTDVPGGGRRVAGSWLSRCHVAGALLPVD